MLRCALLTTISSADTNDRAFRSKILPRLFLFVPCHTRAYSGARIYPAQLNAPGSECMRLIEIPDCNSWHAASSFLFYVLGVFIAGLLVPYNHANLITSSTPTGQQYVHSSPFIIAMKAAGIKGVRFVSTSWVVPAWLFHSCQTSWPFVFSCQHGLRLHLIVRSCHFVLFMLIDLILLFT